MIARASKKYTAASKSKSFSVTVMTFTRKFGKCNAGAFARISQGKLCASIRLEGIRLTHEKSSKTTEKDIIFRFEKKCFFRIQQRNLVQKKT